MIQTEERLVPELRFPEFEGEWAKKKLGEVAHFLDNKRIPLSETERSKRRGEYPYYGASGIIDYIDDYIFDGEYVLLGEDGANIVTRSSRLAFVINGRCWINNHAHILEAKNSNLFLAESLERIRFEKYNTGTAQPKLNSEVCKKILLYLPQSEEQQKIASFLTAVDQRIQLLQRKKAKLEEYKKGVMQQLFSQELRFKDENDHEFPDWEEKKLGEVCDVKGGKRIPKGYSLQDEDNGFPYITVSDMNSGSVRLDNIKYVPKQAVAKIENYRISTDDIFVSVAGTLGIVGVIPKELEDANLTENANKLTNLKCYKWYLLYYLNSEFFKKLVKSVKTTNAQPKLAIYALKSFNLPLPSLSEQQKIASFLSSIDTTIEKVSDQIDASSVFKKGLLQKMFV
ncbi:MAG: restriction endonuclease subunit S [Tunicatimonas sp.]